MNEVQSADSVCEQSSIFLPHFAWLSPSHSSWPCWIYKTHWPVLSRISRSFLLCFHLTIQLFYDILGCKILKLKGLSEIVIDNKLTSLYVFMVCLTLLHFLFVHFSSIPFAFLSQMQKMFCKPFLPNIFRIHFWNFYFLSYNFTVIFSIAWIQNGKEENVRRVLAILSQNIAKNRHHFSTSVCKRECFTTDTKWQLST